MRHSPKQDEPVYRTVTIHTVNKKGYGRGEATTGGEVIVPYTIPGETVEARKLRRKNGELVQILEPSPDRVQPPCRHFTRCGGCIWQHIAYEKQLELKRVKIERLLWDAKIPCPGAIAVHPSAPYEYRNRMDFLWWYTGDFGLRRRGAWHAMEKLDECRLLPAWAAEIAFEVNRRVQAEGLPFRDQKYGNRGLRYLILRRGVFTGEVMLSFVGDPLELPSRLWEGLEPVRSVYHLVNDNLDNDLSEGEPLHLWGEPTYREMILGKEFWIGPRSFFQPNPAVAEAMVEHVRSLLERYPQAGRRLVDLYCGIGMFSVLLADRCEKVLGIEVVPEAILMAKRHGEGCNAEFVCMEAETIMPDTFFEYDTLLLDPPRAGLHP
ncbi:MAG: hypothetical protein RBU29_16900, partial [bacterium]|nr:hypothetical protein [bacterium]